jgi:ABC-2 type transport system ATP-binding protein
MSEKEDIVLEVKSANRRFGQFVAVNDLSFDVKHGELFGMLGPNGAGKTTTINLITGMLGLTGGSIRVLGLDPKAHSREIRKRIGLVPQETNVYADLSAIDNMWHHAALYCDDLSGIGERIKDLLTLMDLWERRKDPVRTYSGGMKRRLALARVLLQDPDIILFDEPTTGVDVQGKHAIWEHIKTQQARGKTFIFSTNEMAEAEALCERLVIIDRGTTVALDTPDNFKAALGRDIVTMRTSPEITDAEAVFAGTGAQSFQTPEPGVLRFEVANAETLVAELVSRVTAAHRLESIHVARPSLDDVFLHYTGRALRE